jgi:hypothetical protein
MMPWSRKGDFHNSRTYEVDEAGPANTGLMFAWAAAALKRRLRAMLDWVAPPSSPAVLLGDGERKYSTLGAKGDNKNPGASDVPRPATRPQGNHDWRVLP